MSMRASTDPRRVYVRHGRPLICYEGAYYSGKEGSKISAEKEVTITVLPSNHGKKRIQVKQGKGSSAVTEPWTQANLKFAKRAPKAA